MCKIIQNITKLWSARKEVYGHLHVKVRKHCAMLWILYFMTCQCEKMFSQCQCNIVRSLSCYNTTMRMSLHQPNVMHIHPADSEKLRKLTWDVFLSVIDRFRAIPADSHWRSTETRGAPVWSQLTMPDSSAVFAAPSQQQVYLTPVLCEFKSTFILFHHTLSWQEKCS